MTKLQLSNPREPALVPIEVAALADGSRATYPYVGPIVLRFKNPRALSVPSCSATRYCSG